MSTTNIDEVIESINNSVSFATEGQRKIARCLGLSICDEIPKTVYAAKLRNELAEELCINDDEVAPKGLVAYTKRLAEELKINAEINEDTKKTECEAWMRFFWGMQNLAASKKNRFQPGDVVALKEDIDETLYIISSFSHDGMVYFKGGRKKAWVGKIKLKAKASSIDNELLREANNNIELHSRSHKWSIEKAEKIKKYKIAENYDEYLVERFDEILRSAKDEKPLQKFIEKYPQILGVTLIGEPKYLIPQKRLGADFVPDFLLADVDSSGISWTLVELETPISSIYLQSNDFDRYTRKGISQVQDWREWLTQNLSYANKPKQENGLGLTGIRPDCDALVLVGKRSLLLEHNPAKRKRLWEHDRIRIRTYEGLLEALNSRVMNGFHPMKTWFLKDDYPFDFNEINNDGWEI